MYISSTSLLSFAPHTSVNTAALLQLSLPLLHMIVHAQPLGFHALFVSEADLKNQVKDATTSGVLTDPDEQAAAAAIITDAVLI
jgi:hypothetical protein